MDSWMVSQRLRRVDHQVVAAGLDASARRASRRAARAARRARRPSRSRVPVRYSQPRPTGGRDRAHGVEDAGARVAAVAPRPRGATRTRCWVVVVPGEVGVELVLHAPGCTDGRACSTPVRREQAGGPAGRAARPSRPAAPRTGRRRRTRPRSHVARTPARRRARPASRVIAAATSRGPYGGLGHAAPASSAVEHDAGREAPGAVGAPPGPRSRGPRSSAAPWSWPSRTRTSW